jgi:hypothetical protein
MITFKFYFQPTFCVEWPIVNILHNKKIIKTFDTSKQVCEVGVKEEKSNLLQIHYFNKKEKHTVHNQNKIIVDQTLQLCNTRVDNIQIEKWYMTDGIYEPLYFKGYLEQLKQSRTNFPIEKKLKSQLIWHFPGVFTFPIFENFWDDYFKNKNDKEIIKFLDVAPDKKDKYRGSLESCKDIAEKIKNLIK